MDSLFHKYFIACLLWCSPSTEIKTSQTPAHIELLKRLPPLRRLEAKLRGSVIATVDLDLEESEAFDDVKDVDWEASVIQGFAGVLHTYCSIYRIQEGSGNVG